MSSRGVGEPEPSYWDNSFKLWWNTYKDSKFRQGMVHYSHFTRPELDTHDLSHATKAPSQHRQSARLYCHPYDMPYPRECAKSVDKLVRCKWDYSVHSIADDAPQCNNAKYEVFDQCPHWVLENLALKKRFYKRAETIDRLTYRRAMEVSDYNR